MRTDIVNGNSPQEITDVKIEVHDGTAWIDISDRRKTLSYSYLNGRWSTDLVFTNTQELRAANLSFAPGHTSSFNPGGVPLLGAYHSVRVWIAKGGPLALVFEGFIGPDVVKSTEAVAEADIVSARCVGIMQPYFDWWIPEAEARIYKDTHISIAENVLNRILEDYGFAPEIDIRDDPMFYIYELEVGNISLGDVVVRAINSIGFDLSERFRTDRFRPTIIDPLRDNTTPDYDLAGNIKLVRASYTEANIRTWVKWWYRDRVTGKMASVIAKDDVARDIYGLPDGRGGKLHRKMEIVEKEISIVDTRGEAKKAASMALHDTSVPCPEIEASLPWTALSIEGGDLVRVITPSETIDIGVTQIRHDIRMHGTTTISGTIAQRIGSRKYWFNRGRTDWPGKHDRDRDKMIGPIPSPPTALDAKGLWGDNEDGSSVPILHLSWHGKQDPRIEGYRVRYKKLELVEIGIATGGTVSTLVDTSKTWLERKYNEFYLKRLGNYADTEQARAIFHNTATELRFDPAFKTPVTAGENYQILKPVGEWNTVDIERFNHIQIMGLRTGQHYLAQVAVIPRGKK